MYKSGNSQASTCKQHLSNQCGFRERGGQLKAVKFQQLNDKSIMHDLCKIETLQFARN